MLFAKLTMDADAAVAESLAPESDRTLPRTSVSVRSDGRTVTLDVTAADTSAMRAALNSYLGFIRITEDIENITR